MKFCLFMLWQEIAGYNNDVRTVIIIFQQKRTKKRMREWEDNNGTWESENSKERLRVYWKWSEMSSCRLHQYAALKTSSVGGKHPLQRDVGRMTIHLHQGQTFTTWHICNTGGYLPPVTFCNHDKSADSTKTVLLRVKFQRKRADLQHKEESNRHRLNVCWKL